jgi:nucleoside-diphosphate-sugar epimerase
MIFTKYLKFEVLIRVAADVMIVNICYLASLAIRLLWKISIDPDISPEGRVMAELQLFGQTFWLLTLICLVVCSLSGFYSRGRFYQGPFKVLVILQAVSLSYIVFGFLLFISESRSLLSEPPRLPLVLSWLLTLGATMGARWWAKLWRSAWVRERPLVRNADDRGRIYHVLVIGGAGYIGSVLCRKLLEQGYSVRILDTFLYGRNSLADLSRDPRLTIVEGDSRDVSAVFRAMLDMDAVVHLGELVGDPACALDEKLTLEINLAATRMVAEAAQGCGVKRFIYASSCSVYGASTRIVDERSALNPVSIYARAKIGSEQTLLGLNGPDFHPVILRLATVYGRSFRPRFDLVVNLLTAKAVCDHEITIFGGNQWRPFVHVADVAQAVLLCLASPLPSVKAGIFNVGSDDQNYTITQVGELIQRVVPEARLVSRGNDGDSRDYHVSFARIRRELAFKPQYTVEDGVREIEAALRAGLINNYQDKRYSNYLTLREPANFMTISSRSITDLYAAPVLARPAEA